ncbi:MAG: sigma-70 family RNA polymerase sigma factor [Bacteroidales bacterium]|nr:sigma-70 family RNA polymerase sigma factor [Bacteroidales bacterium]
MSHPKQSYINLNQEIIDGCREGDKDSQFRLYKLYYRSMYNTSLRIVKDTAEAEDIMQEAFLTAFEKIGTYEGKVSFGSWLKRIVINKSLDTIRKRKIKLTELNEATNNFTIEKETDESEIQFKVESIKKAMEKLPDGYRMVLSLYLFEGYDHEEIGGILGISSSTSRSQFTRAKQHLLKLIKSEK